MYTFCSLFKLLLNQSSEQRTCLIDSSLHTLQNFALEFRQFFQEGLLKLLLKIVSEYDQEIPQSQTADNPVASRGRAA